MNQKGFSKVALLVVALLVIVGGIGYWTLTQQSRMSSGSTTTELPDLQNTNQENKVVTSPAPQAVQPIAPSQQKKNIPPTTNTVGSIKTYSNPQQGFSFQYPNDISRDVYLHVELDDPARGFSIKLQYDGPGGSVYGDVYFNKTSEPDAVAKCLAVPESNAMTYADTGITTISGVPFHSFSASFRFIVSSRMYTTLYRGSCFSILRNTFGPPPDGVMDAAALIDKANVDAKLDPVVESFRLISS